MSFIKKISLAAFLLITSIFSLQSIAYPVPTGHWSLKDSKGNVLAIISFSQAGVNKYNARIVSYPKNKVARCVKCTGKDANKPVRGLVFIKGVSFDGSSFSGGTILNPETGKVSKVKVTLKQNGRAMVINSYGLFGSWFGSSNIWTRSL